jgi:LmbE family N-acetylglucosaminyl deacetylase
MTIIAIGPHPDDPEEGAGGTLARLAYLNQPTKKKEKIIIIYMTSGGAGILGTKTEEACRIREAEAIAACKILHAEPIFLHQSDGNVFPSEKSVQELVNILDKNEPRMILTCWPLDSNADHRGTAYMVIQAYSMVYGNHFYSSFRDPVDPIEIDTSSGAEFPALFFWATEQWHQSLQFAPHCLVSIDETYQYKIEAIKAHASQNHQDHLIKWINKIATNLGEQSEGRFKYAEGFMRMRPSFV